MINNRVKLAILINLGICTVLAIISALALLFHSFKVFDLATSLGMGIIVAIQVQHICWIWPDSKNKETK